MLAPAVMGSLPFRIDDRPLPNFYDAIASDKPDGFRRFDEVDVSPLIAVVVNVIGHFAEKNTLRLEDLVSFFEKRGKRMRETITVFFRGPDTQSEAVGKVL